MQTRVITKKSTRFRVLMKKFETKVNFQAMCSFPIFPVTYTKVSFKKVNAQLLYLVNKHTIYILMEFDQTRQT